MIALKKDLVISEGQRGYRLYKTGEQYVSLRFNINPDGKSLQVQPYMSNIDGQHVGELESTSLNITENAISVNGDTTEQEKAYETSIKEFIPVLTKKGLEIIGALKVGKHDGTGVVLSSVL